MARAARARRTEGVDTSFEGTTVAEAIPGVPEIFGQALEIESLEERLEFLDQACSGDARRRADDRSP